MNKWTIRAIVFGLVFFIIFLINKFKISIKTKFGEVNPIKEDEIEELEAINKIEIISIEKREFIQIINRIKTSMEKIANIERINKLEKQMKFAEETLIALNFKAEKDFISFLKKKKNIKNIKTDIKNFEGISRISYDKILEILKISFKENGFEKKVGRDFDDYVERKLTVISKAIKDIHNDFLSPFFIINETEFNDFVHSQKEEQKKSIANIFKNAQQEYSKAREEMFKEDMALDEFIWSLVDVKKENNNDS